MRTLDFAYSGQCIIFELLRALIVHNSPNACAYARRVLCKIVTIEKLECGQKYCYYWLSISLRTLTPVRHCDFLHLLLFEDNNVGVYIVQLVFVAKEIESAQRTCGRCHGIRSPCPMRVLTQINASANVNYTLRQWYSYSCSFLFKM